MKIGEKYVLDGASQSGRTRDGKEIVIPPFSTVEKIRENFVDKLKLRNMFMICGTGQEVDIGQSIIKRYFRPKTKDGV